MASPGILHQLSALSATVLLSAGLYLHEFTANLPYDLSILKRSDDARPVIAHVVKWTYLACRILCLIFVACAAATVFPGQTGCQASGFLGMICARFLVAIRAIAIWAWVKWIVVVMTVIILTSLAFAIFFIVKVDSVYDADVGLCTLNGIRNDFVPSVAMLLCDCIIMTLLLTGLQRNWGDTRKLEIWGILWKQGLLYLFIAALFEVPIVTMLSINISPFLNSVQSSSFVIAFRG
ncbi:hypothetical protein PENSPDRAFT_688138 [Peniophora sp. CONT]|nr:hypothetical protein PENSPDRAFT_688138 [Peniophora sp. CONT]